MEIADILMEMPQPFRVGDRQFNLYPVSLGKSYYLARLSGSLGINDRLLRLNPYAEALRLASSCKHDLCRIIGCHTVNSREELFDTALMEEITEVLTAGLSDKEAATLFAMTVTDADMQELTKRLGIYADKLRREEVMAVKRHDKNTYTFGGNSVFGAVIAPACEKLHMTPRQVVWDISLMFLNLILSDMITQVYLTDDERKRCHISNDHIRINADDKESIQQIISMNWD